MTNTERKTERLYLTAWNYNAARILSALAVIVENNGGEIIYHSFDKNYLISNRGVKNVIEEKEHYIDLTRNCDKWKGRSVEELEKELAAYKEKCGNEAENPIFCTHRNYISFTYDGAYYKYYTDENPFFDFYYNKYPIENGKYDANRYAVEDKKEWLFDCFFGAGCSEDDIKEAANMIFNMLVKSAYSEQDYEKKRVPNIYDNGYHYERIHKKRMLKIGDLY